MDLHKAEKLAKELLREHNPEYTFKWDNAKVRFGACHYKTKQISLSKHLTYMNNEDEVKDTILHEIAHSLTKGKNHNRVWRAKAVELGCCGARCYDNNKVESPKGKYVYQCPICENKYYHHRRSRRKSACGKCCKAYNNNKYSKDYELVFLGVRNGTNRTRK